ncbi:MAG: ABC transporter permease [Desulfobacteraceae bacterium]|nr:MAG: ABC transporter permease [Desulfobacteraceae bacterium]
MKGTLRKILDNGITLTAVGVLAAVFFMALSAPLISPYDPAVGELGDRLLPPLSQGHLFGTDPMGRDLLTRVIYGARISIIVSLAAVFLAGCFGILAGLVSGYYGGWADRIIMRIVDVQLSFPFVILALTIAAVLGPSLRNIIITLAVSNWVLYARLVRGEVLGIKEKQFVQAAFTVGLPHRRIMGAHILPNVVAPVIVLASLEVGRMIITEAAISFLGFGIQPPTAAWGNILSEGRDYMTTAWWLTVFPGLAIVATTLAVNIVGDVVRDRLDPKLRLQ